MNEMNQDNMRTEIATLEEDVPISDEAIYRTIKGKFKIPVLMTTDTVASVQTSNKNVLNRNNGSLKGSSMNLNNTISLTIPKEYILCYKGTKIPKGSKFLVSFVSANVNDIKVIGRYDGDKADEISSERSILEYILDKLKNHEERLENHEQRISTIEAILSIQSTTITETVSRTDQLETRTNNLEDRSNQLQAEQSELERSNYELSERVTYLENNQDGGD
jgi:DNA repair exonuclease SbcCD ATPase subunit